MNAQRPFQKSSEAQSILLGCYALFLAATIYGIICYRAAPIKMRKDGRYRDKEGHEFTAAQFQRFRVWEACFAASWGLVVISGAAFSISKRKSN